LLHCPESTCKNAGCTVMLAVNWKQERNVHKTVTKQNKKMLLSKTVGTVTDVIHSASGNNCWCIDYLFILIIYLYQLLTCIHQIIDRSANTHISRVLSVEQLRHHRLD